VNPHLKTLAARHPSLHPILPQIEDAWHLLAGCFLSGRKLLLCGNGGSAADADHWAGELLKGFTQPRPLPPALAHGLSPETAARLQWALPAIPLTGFPALASAYANDVDPEFVFAQLVLGLGRAGDVLVALSTSGNSANVCRAAEVARARGLKVLALTGADGGKLKSLADLWLGVPSVSTPHVQELHLPIYHCLCLLLEEQFAANPELLTPIPS
jgi:D-sedoheptulose 7-phosphate isomerase